MKLVLYNPRSTASRKRILPLSLLALGAVLEGRHEYVIVDGNLENNPLARLDDLVANWGAEALGVTVMPGPQLEEAVPLCGELKRRHPDLAIIWGGYFPTQHSDVCLGAPYVDYVVRGHGELPFLELLDVLDNGGALADVPSLVFRDGSGGSLPEHAERQDGRVTTRLAPVPHPGQLPEFPYHRVPVERYTKDCHLGRRTLPHHSSYGCPFFCSFCAVVNMVNGRWLAQSAERTAGVARYLHDTWGADAVEFYDNNFFVHEARTAEFAQRIMDLRMGWWGEARIDTLLKYRPATWQMMADSGLRMMFMGAESGSDETLKRMNKGGSAAAEKTIEIARLMKSYGIVPEFSFVLGSPPDPETDTRQTIDFIRRVKEANPAAEIIMYMYTPVPLAGDLYESAVAEGFAFPTTLEEWVSSDWRSFSQRRSTSMPWVRTTLRDHVRDFERVLNAYYPTSTNALLEGPACWVLRTVASWRYHLRVYEYPVELRALNRLLAYQRPDTTGF